jgi:hypothetical protein
LLATGYGGIDEKYFALIGELFYRPNGIQKMSKRGPSRTYTLSDVRGTMRGLEDAGDLPATAPEITNAMNEDPSSSTVLDRLRELHENGEAEKIDAGSHDVWELTSKGLEADADLSNQISGILESAEPEDIPSDQAAWIAESLSAEFFSDEKKIEMIETIETNQFPDYVINEILESIDPQSIPNNKIIAAIETADIDSEDVPDEFAEGLVRERFGYVVSYWGDSVRNGVQLLAFSGFLTSIGFLIILLKFQIGPFELPAIAGISLPTIIIGSEIIGSLTILFGLLFAGAGILPLVIGLLGHKYTTVKDPRPWREFLINKLRDEL